MTVRRILTSALALIMIMSTFACGGKDNNSSNGTTTQTPPANNDAVVSWMSAGYYKNLQSYTGPKDKKTEYDLYMAKNESESLQIAIRVSENTNDVTFSFECELPLGIKAELFEVKTILIEKERWPDGLVPVSDGKSFDLKKDKTFSLLVKLTSNNNTPSGKNVIKMFASDGEGNIIAEYNINLTVWNITIPEKPSITTYMPIDKESLAKQYGLGDLRRDTLTVEQQAELDRIYKQYYDFLLEYGISGGALPYDILDPRADAYLDDPRVTTFTVASNEFDPEKVKAIYNKIKDNPLWLSKAVYYVLDEPTTSEMLDELKRRADEFRKIAPDVNIASSYYANVQHSSGVDITTFLQQNIDVPTPKLCLFNKMSGGMEGYKARFEEFKANGNKLWTYVCWEPAKPYVNIFVNEQGVDHRVMFIQTYDIGADGWLYWCANKWYDIENGISPWNSMQTIPWMTYDVYGDGSLLYPGNDVGVEGPCPSIRLECVKDGIEDIALLKMAEELLGKEATDELVDQVTVNIVQYTEDEGRFNAFRIALGNAIEAALEK